MAMSAEVLALVKGAKSKYTRNTGRAVKLKEGRTRIRLLKAPDQAKFWADLGVHWIKTSATGKPVAVVGCEDEVHEKPCAICTAAAKAVEAVSDDESLKVVKDWKTKKSILVNALIREGPSDASDDTPVVLELTPTTFGSILSVMEEWGADVDPFDLVEGVDFVIERKGRGLDTEYTVTPAHKSKPVNKDVLNRLINLDEFITKEFFRGDERKALAAIQATTGVSVATLSAPGAGTYGASSPAALASRDSVIEEIDDGEIEEIASIDESSEASAPVETSAETAATPSVAVSEPSSAEKDKSFGEPLEDDDMDDILKELEGIGT